MIAVLGVLGVLLLVAGLIWALVAASKDGAVTGEKHEKADAQKRADVAETMAGVRPAQDLDELRARARRRRDGDPGRGVL